MQDKNIVSFCPSTGLNALLSKISIYDATAERTMGVQSLAQTSPHLPLTGLLLQWQQLTWVLCHPGATTSKPHRSASNCSDMVTILLITSRFTACFLVKRAKKETSWLLRELLPAAVTSPPTTLRALVANGFFPYFCLCKNREKLLADQWLTTKHLQGQWGAGQRWCCGVEQTCMVASCSGQWLSLFFH